MKVLFINGSPHEDGVCNRGILEMQEIFKEENIETEVLFLGSEPIYQCSGCGFCYKNKRCVRDDLVNKVGENLDNYDAIIASSAVHYASATGYITTFLDRLFYCYGKKMRGKVYANFVSARRGGTTAALDQLNKYGLIAGMIMVGGQYWNMIHGNNKEEVLEDKEGLQNLRTLARNISYVLKLIENGKDNNIIYPEREKFTGTNFVRN